MTEPAFHVRPATVDDVPILVEARHRMFIDMDEDDLGALDALDVSFGEWLAEHLPKGTVTGLIAEDADGRWLGAVSVRHDATPPSMGNPHGGQSYVFGAWVRHDSRRQGIATALVSAAVDAAREAGEGAVLLMTTEAGAAVYRKLGFEDAPAMRLWLEQGDDRK